MARTKKVVAQAEVVIEQVVTPEAIIETVPELVVESVVVEQTEAQTETTEVTKAKVEKNEGVGQFIRNLISEGLGNKEVLKIVHEQYGNTSTTYACVAWYRNKMKKTLGQNETSHALSFVQKFLATATTEDIYLAQEELRKYG